MRTWKTEETWLAYTWIKQDEDAIEAIEGMLEDAYKWAEMTGESTDKQVAYAGELLQSYLENLIPSIGPSLWEGLLIQAFTRIEWEQLIQYFQEDIIERELVKMEGL